MTASIFTRLAFIGILPFSVHAADWPQFLGPTRNCISAETNFTAAWPAEGPPILWHKPVGQGFSGPVVSQGKLILFHRLDNNEIIDCLDAKDGHSLWRFSYPTHYRDDFGFDEGPRATPAIDGGRIYTMGAEGMVHCLDLQSGKKIWSVDCKEQFAAGKGFFGMACSPLVEAGAVILNIGGADGAGIVALDGLTGKIRWKTTSDEASYSSPVAANIGGVHYVFVFDRAGLAAVNPENGALYFQYPWRSEMNASVNAATPIVSDGMVFLTASYDTGAILLRVRKDGADKIWSGDDSLSSHYATSVLKDGFLYGINGRTDPGMEPRPSLRCVEFKTGKVRWAEDNFGAASVTLAGGQLLLLTDHGELIRCAANPGGYKATGRAQVLPFGVRDFPALADGLFYARSKDKLVCVKLK